jgi:hypothetical protein
MVYAKSVRPILVAALVGLLPACGPALNSNFEAATDEASSSDVVMMTGEQFLFALSEDQSEVESLGLKGKKEKKQAKKAKASAQKSKKVGVAAQAKKAAKANRKEAKEALKRAENLQTARKSIREINKMPNKGLLQAEEKCKAIHAAAKELKEKQNIPSPFAGLRQKLISSLAKDRAKLLKANGLASCQAARKLADSVPAPVPEEAVLDEAAAAEEEVVAEEAGAAEEISLPEGVTIILPDGTVLSGFETIIVRR